ncbi:MAG: hypothetical protein ACJ8EB_11875, partial [Allosphingosinicella sp.]
MTSVLAVAAAIGGALLTVSGQVLLDLFRDHREAQKEATDAKKAALDALVKEYEELGDLPRRAQAYLDGENEGSPADARIMARHFRRLIIAVLADRVLRKDVQRYYGKELLGWGARFSMLADGRSFRQQDFSPVEKANFGT